MVGETAITHTDLLIVMEEDKPMKLNYHNPLDTVPRKIRNSVNTVR